jgi:FkbH-like protein
MAGDASAVSPAPVTTWEGLPPDLKPADYLRLARELQSAPAGLAPLRVACLSSHSLEFVRPYLAVEGARVGFAVTSYFGPFGQMEQELANPGSGLAQFGPDALVLALRPEDVDPDAVVRFYQSGGRRFRALATDLTERLAASARAFRERWTGPVLVANFAAPAVAPLGVFDASGDGSLTYELAAANAELRRRVSGIPGTVIWDYAGLAAAGGLEGWTDRRLWALARIAVAARHQPRLAAHLARTVRAVLRTPAKCLVLDLDETLWGGVLGDDGLHGVQLGDDYPGNAFKMFQRSVLALRDRGILLAVVSKNYQDVVEQMFREHPEMLIRWEDLAAVRINWSPKSGNLREVAAELNLGLDALVLFDDNPVERAEVRANAPEVTVIEVPADPLAYGEALAGAPAFDQLSLSDEDRTRAAMYREEGQRRALAERATTPEEFLRSLEMVARVGLAEPGTLGRIAQLVSKTNQFNLTTRRHTPAELAAMADDPRAVVAWLRLADRFGDQGLVAVGILRAEGTRAGIDTFLMSCRVMNRGVEQALAAYLAEHARRLGCREMVGEYLPTKKNGMVKDLYPTLGFRPADDQGRVFHLDLSTGGVPWPPEIRREDGGA